MKKVVFGVLALAVASGAAQAINVTWQPINGATAGGGFTERTQNTVVFSAIPGPYVAAPAATGSLGMDDYDSIHPDPFMLLQSMRFVGGVTAVGGIADFLFFDSAGNFWNGFSIAFPSAGNFIWSIDLGDDTSATTKDSSFLVPADGRLQIVARTGTTGQWFLSTTVPSVGTQNPAIGTATTHSHRFELTAPTPGALALLGLGGLVAGRRRR